MTDNWREQKDAFLRESEHSPLTDAQKAAFTGTTYYDYDPAWDLTVTVERFDAGDTAQVFTTKDMIRNYGRYGRFSVSVDGETVQLTIYQTPHGFFLTFVDANAGTETYPAGRYIDPEQIDATIFRVNFNRAYNPFCAYNDRYDCPITPKENRLNVAIRAGEKLPPTEWKDA